MVNAWSNRSHLVRQEHLQIGQVHLGVVAQQPAAGLRLVYARAGFRGSGATDPGASGVWQRAHQAALSAGAAPLGCKLGTASLNLIASTNLLELNNALARTQDPH
jgi:hypothetical protein